MKTIFLKGLCGLSLAMIPEAVLASSANNLKSISPHQYTHLIETYQSQTFEPLSRTALFLEQSASENTYKTAGVYFITNSKGQVFRGASSDNSFDDPSGKQCTGEGFNLTSCNGTAYEFCPYNNSYFKTCCDAAYNYTEENCSLLNTSSSCGGKYKCDCSPEKYPATANSCPSPQSPTTESGSSCVVNGEVRYTKCVCPEGVDAPHGCETYYAGVCSKVCKTAYSDNCRNRESVQTPYGCETFFDDCDSKCEKAYTDNCRNRIDVPTPHGCEQYYADCQSKCEMAYGDNCRNRTAVNSSKYGCEKYFDDCGSKCEKAYEDNCHNQVAVLDTCPDDVTCTYFSDCKSKIKDWKCRSSNSEYCQKTENGCLCLGDIVYGDGTVKGGSLLTDKKPIGVVIHLEKRLAMSLTYVKKNGTPGAEAMPWSSGAGCAVPNKFYHGLCSTCDTPTYKDSPHYVANDSADGSVVTSQILAATCNGTPYAAQACNAYQPEGCTSEFCRKGKWFLGTYPEFSYTNYSYIKQGLETAGGYRSLPEGKDAYWTSTAVSATSMWESNYGAGGGANKTSSGSYLSYYARPLVKF